MTISIQTFVHDLQSVMRKHFQDFQVILKRILQNYLKILNICVLMKYYPRSDMSIMLPVAKELLTFYFLCA